MIYNLTENQSYDVKFLESYQASTAGDKVTFHQELSPADIIAIEAHFNEMSWPERDAIKAKEAERKELQKTRDASLDAIVYDFNDGRVMQVRPQDLSNIQLAIQLGQPQEWVMNDNTVALMTVAELTTALNSGVVQGKVIWQDYIDAVKVL